MLIGYARVSTQDQNLALQREALTQAGCEKILEDQLSGSRAERPGLSRAMEELRPGDTLVVWKLDRLGRSVRNLIDLVSSLQDRGVQFRSLTDAIDTGTPSGRFFFHVMASLAAMERDLTIERTRAGLDAARKLGRKPGRKRLMTESKIASARKLLGNGTPRREVAEHLGVSTGPHDDDTDRGGDEADFVRRSFPSRVSVDGSVRSANGNSLFGRNS